MFRKNGLESQGKQQLYIYLSNKHLPSKAKLAIYLLSCFLILSLSACFKTNKTPVPQQAAETERSTNNNLETSNTTDINKWLIPLISEYLMDDEPPPPPAPTCGDNTGTIGDMTLTTQTDVNVFLTNGVGKIDGDLILNPSSDLDLSPLSLLTEITGKLELKDNANQTTLNGFDCLTAVKGTDTDDGIIIQNNSELVSIEGFPKLATIGRDLAIKQNPKLLIIPLFPELTALQSIGDLFIRENALLTTIAGFPKLATIGDDLIIYQNPMLTSIPEFPVLTALQSNLGDLLIQENDLLTTIAGFPKLETIGSRLIIKLNPKLESIPEFPELTAIQNDLLIQENDLLTTIAGFPKLATIGDILSIRQNPKLLSIPEFPELTAIQGSGDLDIQLNDVLETIAGFPKLATIGDDLFINQNPKLLSIPLFPELTTLQLGDLTIQENALLATIAGFPKLATVVGDLTITNNEKLISIFGFDVLNSGGITGTSTVSNNALLNCQSPDPHFTPVDFSTGNAVNCKLPPPTCGANTGVHNGNITLTTKTEVDAFLTNGIGKIDGDLILNPSSDLDLSPLSLLTEITGKLELKDNANQTSLAGFDCLTAVKGTDIGDGIIIQNNAELVSIGGFSKLATIGLSLFIYQNPKLLSIQLFPELTTLQSNDLLIRENALLETIAGFPKLATIGDVLIIFENPKLLSIPLFPELTAIQGTGDLNIQFNDVLETIAGFPKLATIGDTLIINRNPKLLSIPLFPELTALQSITGDLTIEENALLTTIAGFPKLATIGDDLFISKNPKLLSIPEFPELTALQRTSSDFRITDNALLTTIVGFPKLATIGRHLYIFANPKLLSIPLFPELTALQSNFGDLYIQNNALLTTIDGFPKLDTIGKDLFITDNEKLTSISGFNVLDSSGIGGTSTVNNNAMLNCQTPDPHFTPVDVSTGNAANGNCYKDIAVVAYALANEESNPAGYTPDSSFSYTTGSSISAFRTGTGAYTITFDGLTLDTHSNVQVTSSSFFDHYCNVLSTSGTLQIRVRCFDASEDAAVDSKFYISITQKTVASAAKVTAFTYLDNATPTGSYVPPAATSYNSYFTGTGTGITVSRLFTGFYQATFTNADFSEANIQVTAASPNTFCFVREGLVQDIVTIQCHKQSDGLIIDASFYISVVEKTPPTTTTEVVGYALADDETNTGTYTANPDSSYNASGSPITIGRDASGQTYTVDFAGLDLSTDYSVQVSPIEGSDHTCNFGSIIGSSTVPVFCRNLIGGLADTPFSIWVVKK